MTTEELIKILEKYPGHKVDIKEYPGRCSGIFPLKEDRHIQVRGNDVIFVWPDKKEYRNYNE